MVFHPINGEHAIQTVLFSISLNMPLTSVDLNAIRSNHKRFRAELPAISHPQSYDIQLESPGAPPKAVASQGVDFAFLRQDGTAAWVLRTLGSDVTVECSRYTRWNKTWGRARRYFNEALQLISKPDPEKQILAFNLTIVDRFRAENVQDDAGGLLKRSHFVPEQVFSAGPLWHQHSGWFAHSGTNQVLNQLNLDSRLELAEDEVEEMSNQLFVSIQHVQSWRPQVPPPIRGFLNNGLIVLDEAMHYMHDVNKSVVAAVISDEMLRRIDFFSLEESSQ